MIKLRVWWITANPIARMLVTGLIVVVAYVGLCIIWDAAS